ncbi:MAG: nucleoside triphosphate pyrophosphohydrolase [Chloroflexi bacterium]|nr:nucleoside triphosphate pyrophosphohydrolase [Ktedonobacteraceae bacterium]MBV9708119.1 nucleoside triphosphate pyrophosphohydrolase [Chloroflexota bacterium]
MTVITIVGLGPGSMSDLTLRAQRILEKAAADKTPVYFRTFIHPTIDPLKQAFPDLRIESFDYLYEAAADWGTLYQQIADTVCTLAAQGPIIYAVPGHPLIGESSVQLLLEQAREHSLSTDVVAGLSFLEPVCTLLGLDPCNAHMQLVDATNLAALRADEVAGKIIPTLPLLVAQVYNRRLASEVKLALGECYPDEWPVKLVRAAGIESDESVLQIPLHDLDRNSYANHLTTLYVPPVDELTALRLPETLRFLIMRLRRDPDGCPWDRQQTHHSLIRYVLEETYEVVEALEENDMAKLAEELGDLLLQVYLHAEIARQESDFSLGDIYEHINAKLIRRHPHVFGSVEASNAEQVKQNWEDIKRQERAEAGANVQQESVLDRVPLASPSLVVAQEYQKRTIRKGFDYPTIEEIYAKLAEELQELQDATTAEQQHEEMGDILFIAAHLAHFLSINAEQALRQANRKFRRRFQFVEQIAQQQGRELTSYSLQEWRDLWRLAKAAAARRE